MLLWLLGFAWANDPIRYVQIFDSASKMVAREEDPNTRHLEWPFCPTHNKGRCTEKRWIQLGIDIDAYMIRRNNAHQSMQEIVDTSIEDVRPIIAEIVRYLDDKNDTSNTSKVGYVQGMIQAIHYAYDDCNGEANCTNANSTGWSDYPKFTLEFFFDQLGDCDDASISNGAMLVAMGLEPYFVFWEQPGGAHISNALKRATPGIAEVEIPKDSFLIEDPKSGHSYLHVDAVGTVGGCTPNCPPLGWNEWPKDGYKVTKITAVLSDNLDKEVPIKAWSIKTKRFPNQRSRDRRSVSREEVVEEIKLKEQQWEENNVRRLRYLGEEEETARKIVLIVPRDYRSQSSSLALSALIALMMGILGLIGYRSHKRKIEDQQKREILRKKKEQERF
ncbi:MAG: hypothetical protein VX278_05060 [Myxococcota bacterium]|nr:hypothetical protein [Myxococcota bacterium]